MNKSRKILLFIVLMVSLLVLGGCAEVSYCDIKINKDLTGTIVVKIFGEGISRSAVQAELKGLEGYELTPIEENIDKLENGKPTKMDGWKIEYPWKNTEELKKALSFMLKNPLAGKDSKNAIPAPIVKGSEADANVTVNFGKNPYDKMTVTVPGKINMEGKPAGEFITFKKGEDVQFSFKASNFFKNTIYYSIGGGLAVMVLGGGLFFWQRKKTSKKGVSTNE